MRSLLMFGMVSLVMIERLLSRRTRWSCVQRAESRQPACCNKTTNAEAPLHYVL